MIQLINDYRSARGLRPLVISSSLTSGALEWSQTLDKWIGTPVYDGAMIGRQTVTGWSGLGVVGGTPGADGWWEGGGPLPTYCQTGMPPESAEFFMCDLLSSPSARAVIDNPKNLQVGSGTVMSHDDLGPRIFITQHFSTAEPAGGAIPPAAAPTIAEPGHSIDATSSGRQVVLALKSDGKLWVRRDLADGEGWSSWIAVEVGRWVATDVTISGDGSVHVVAVKETGELFTRTLQRRGGWHDWVDHGAGWSTTTMPSISSNYRDVLLAAVTASGRLKTMTYEADGWSEATSHGAGGWAHIDADIAADGDLWFAGTKTDGRLYLRKHLGSAWSGFAKMGAPTWSGTTPPSIAARSHGVVFGAVKTDGRMYTREQVDGRWARYVRHGVKDWSSIDVAMTEQGQIVLAAHKSWGRLYTRAMPADGTWAPWVRHGRDTWSPNADPSIAFSAGGQPVLMAVKASGVLYRRHTGPTGWDSWTALGRGSWSTAS